MTVEDRSVRALCTARNEIARIGQTVTALLEIPGLDSVTVVDDGSDDPTAAEASRAGARVIRLPRRGKGAALDTALDVADYADVYLLADGDLGASAVELRALLEPVLEGRADLAVAVAPTPPTGGFGLVKGLAAWSIDRMAGNRSIAPLSGQRALTRECLWAARPLARGFGLETAMTADALRLGFRVLELPVTIEHRFTDRDVAGFTHRGRQGIDVLRAALPRLVGIR